MVEQRLLTETELEIMKVLWALEGGTVREVLNQLPKARKMAYTSASTIIRILEKKQFVSSRKEGMAHVYTPLLTREDYESTSLSDLASKLFDEAPLSMVARLIDDQTLDEKELKKLRQLIDRKLKQ